MAAVFTDTPKIGVNIAATIAEDEMAFTGHRANSTVYGSDGEIYVFTVNGGTGAGTWVKDE